MIIEGIKNLLGEDLTKQVETALKGNVFRLDVEPRCPCYGRLGE